nr:hypothetical protein [Tanacetum cinerariifolium]
MSGLDQQKTDTTDRVSYQSRMRSRRERRGHQFGNLHRSIVRGTVLCKKERYEKPDEKEIKPPGAGNF